MERSNKYRVTQVSNKGNRNVSIMSEQELQKLRAKRFQAIRKDELGLTQKLLADAIGVKFTYITRLGNRTLSHAKTG